LSSRPIMPRRAALTPVVRTPGLEPGRDYSQGILSPLRLPEVSIILFGPSPVHHGQPFNVVSNGQSAIFVKLDRQAEPDYVLTMNNEELTTVIDGDVLTAVVPKRLFANNGFLALRVQAIRNVRRYVSQPVVFVVQ
jgi:hypothetical protein